MITELCITGIHFNMHIILVYNFLNIDKEVCSLQNNCNLQNNSYMAKMQTQKYFYVLKNKMLTVLYGLHVKNKSSFNMVSVILNNTAIKIYSLKNYVLMKNQYDQRFFNNSL